MGLKKIKGFEKEWINLVTIYLSKVELLNDKERNIFPKCFQVFAMPRYIYEVEKKKEIHKEK